MIRMTSDSSPVASSKNAASAIVTARRARFERPATATAATAFVLAVVDGPDAGLVVTLDSEGASRTLIGQSPVCTIRLTDPEVSRRHAAIAVDGDRLSLIDLGSTNGTTVNGVTVKEAMLQGGEAIRIGRTVLSVRREAPRFVTVARAGSFGRLLGESPSMRKLFAVLTSAAASDRALLLEGETGTGKELTAEELHLASPRKDGPFVAFSTRSLGSDEIGVRLFGGVGEPGLIPQAIGGTLFINDIADLPMDVQARLLDVLQGDGGRDVRIIAATRADLDRAVADGRFHEALVQLLAPGRVELPPLRERQGDVAVLARAFWADISPDAELPSDFLPRFEHYPWPGNVRELKGAVLARMTLGELGSSYRTEDAKAQGLDFLTAVIEEDLPFPTARERVVKEFERRYVERVLARHGGSVVRAARASGVAHRYFQLVRARVR